jgi:quercetin dioxygenase-like cupin family protein
VTATPMFREHVDAPVAEPRPEVQIRPLVRGVWLETVEYTVPKGFVAGAADYEQYEKAGYVVRGSMEIATPDGTHLIGAGGSYALPRGVPHRFTVIEDAVIVQTRSPAPDGLTPSWPGG